MSSNDHKQTASSRETQDLRWSHDRPSFIVHPAQGGWSADPRLEDMALRIGSHLRAVSRSILAAQRSVATPSLRAGSSSSGGDYTSTSTSHMGILGAAMLLG